MMTGLKLLVLIQDEVYYWEPFYKILVDDEKMAEVCAENIPETRFDPNFMNLRSSVYGKRCQKIYLPKSIYHKYLHATKLIRSYRNQHVMLTQYITFFNVYCLLIAKLFSCTVHFKGEGILLKGERIRATKRLYLTVFLNLCKFVYYSCSGNKRLFEAILPKKKLTPMWCFSTNIDPKFYKAENDYFRGNKLNIILCGRFIEEKNFQVIAQAFRSYSDICKKVHVHIIGSGPMLTELLKQFSKLDLDFTNHGYVPPNQVPALMQRYGDVLFLPSLRDNSPKILNEAMNVGLAVMVSNNCGTVDDLVIDGWNGFSFPPKDIDKINRALEHLTSEPKLAIEMGQKSQDKVKSFTAEHAAKNLISNMRYKIN